MAIIDHGEMVAQGSIRGDQKTTGGSNGIVVSILNSEELEKKLSNLHYRFEINAGKNNKITDVFIFEGISEYINEILDTSTLALLPHFWFLLHWENRCSL